MKTRDLAYIALFAAIVAVLGLIPPIAVPLVPVPITAQTLGVMLAGSVLGVWLFSLLKRAGQIELTISVCYVLLLGTLGFLMAIESIRAVTLVNRLWGLIPRSAALATLGERESGTAWLERASDAGAPRCRKGRASACRSTGR